jgi:tRNA dimethylallyltransferase
MRCASFGASRAAVAATRQLAKRQLTWLRAMPSRQVIDADAGDATPRALAAARALVESLR